jgi:CheY-like chemotaxis protein
MSAILIVDDDPAICSLIQEILAGKGHACATSQSGPDALDKLASGRYDLVILDHNMPKMTGTDILLQLRADPRHAKLLVVICTADSLFQRKAEAGTAAGRPDGCVSKPVDMKKLVDLVTTLTGPASRPTNTA